MVPVDSVGVPRAPTYSGTSCKRRRFNCRVRGCHPLWLTFPDHSASRPLCNSYKRPYNPAGKIPTVWAVPLSLAATDGIDFSFSSTGYLDVSVHRVSDPYLWIQYGTVRESWDHHSFVNSPRLFADFHALLRLLTPRHPPCALNSLTTYLQRSPDCRQMPAHSSRRVQACFPPCSRELTGYNDNFDLSLRPSPASTAPAIDTAAKT